MVTWFFGASSDWSQQLISKLNGQVFQFSRSAELRRNPDIDAITVEYDPVGAKEWIETVALMQPKPNKVIFNINTGNVKELSENIIEDVSNEYEHFNEWWFNNREQLFFRTLLMNFLHKTYNFQGEVCHITSQISADHNPRWKDLQMYKTLRAVDYELIWNNRNNGMDAYGICPAANTRPLEWADFIAFQINAGNLGKNNWLYGIDEVVDTGELRMIKYGDWSNEGIV